MTTTFSQMLSICGLSQQEAAEFFNIRLDTVKSWCSGRRSPNETVFDELAKLYALMGRASDEALDLIEEQTEINGASPDKIEFSYSGDHGRWPSVRCAMTVEAMIRLQHPTID